jgi:hypothetical protein
VLRVVNYGILKIRLTLVLSIVTGRDDCFQEIVFVTLQCVPPNVGALKQENSNFYYGGVGLFFCGTAAANGFIVSHSMSSGGMILTRGKPKYSEKNLSLCHFVHHKSHMDCPRSEPGPASNGLCYGYVLFC